MGRPQGIYTVKIGHLSTIDRDVPLLENVPSFTGIYIHTGASTANTTGCIIIGDYKDGVWSANGRYVNELTDMVRDVNQTTINVYNA